MTEQPRIGLLPLYLELYDECLPKLRGELEPFLGEVAAALTRQGLQVQTTPICRVRDEFAGALADLEAAGIDLLVTLHLAYSPSLESAELLASFQAPILMLDTTPDADFGLAVNPLRLLYNHGIHGVQDLASVLRRLGRQCRIVAGHWRAPGVLEQVACHAQAAQGAARLRSTRALRIGGSFAGMGDFAVDPNTLQTRLGITSEQLSPADLGPFIKQVTDVQIEAELHADRTRFDCVAPEEVHHRTLRICLGLRACLERGGWDAFSLNFKDFNTGHGLVNTVPFLEVCKAMSRGLGYAGEGDVLTAALVGVLARTWGATTFTEIFCPDWTGNALFLSHMGEVNPDLLAGRARLYEKEFPFTPALNPAALAGALAAGPGVFVNLAPGPDDSFALLAAPVTLLGDGSHADLAQWIRGWMQPVCPVARFLEEFSRHGGTHHSALIMGDRLAAVQALADYAGLPCHVIGL